MVGRIEALEAAGALRSGAGRALIAILEQTLARLAADAGTPACAQLGAFIRQVTALRGTGGVAAEEAHALNAEAGAILAIICT
jgi:hypothetical protein